jgi:predicted HAD superfamily Cof-like phosphohydrolase
MIKTPQTVDQVRVFQTSMDQKVDAAWDNNLAKMRMALITEEYKEVKQALDVVCVEHERGAISKVSAAELLKELCDLQYVLDGFFVAFGLPKEAAFNRVHASNMSKLGGDGKPVYREDGKVMKGPNYTKPNLEDLI